MTQNEALGVPGTQPGSSRAVALARLEAFIPRMGRAYASKRNYDLGPGRHAHVSCLSPFVRYRVLSERELVSAAFKAHGYQAAEKFIQEVFWRTYWKGWLEARPAIWSRYQADVSAQMGSLSHSPDLEAAYTRAVQAETGIDCFDTWVRELRETGYLHNHARMWFASIWIFTLKLPWQLGADFFLHHLLDGDAASNTLSWRWVAGLQTKGKTYLARADNIEKFTNGRFNPVGQLNTVATTLDDDIPPPAAVPPQSPLPDEPITLITTDDCLTPLDHLPPKATLRRVLHLPSVQNRTPSGVSALVAAFVAQQRQDMVDRMAKEGIPVEVLPAVSTSSPDPAAAAFAALPSALPSGEALVVLQPPVGDGLDTLAAVRDRITQPVSAYRAPWDTACFPYCTKGFFAFKKHIPALMAQLVG